MDHVCDQFIDMDKHAEKTFFRIKTASARLISMFSKYVEEAEYILLPGNKIHRSKEKRFRKTRRKE